MTAKVQADMDWSSILFMSEVWPAIQAKYKKTGNLLQMEGRPDIELARALDIRSGIDGWEMTADGGMRGVASRMQEGRAWNSFTVRMTRRSGAETEYAKRKKAIESDKGLIFPHLTVQAFAETKTGPVISIGICKTKDLIKFIDDGLHETRPTDNATFAVCYWRKMIENGVPVWIVNNDLLT